MASPETTGGDFPSEAQYLVYIHSILRTTILGDDDNPRAVKKEINDLRIRLARESQPSADPLSDPKVAFGYIMALSQFASVAERMIIPAPDLAFLHSNEAAYRGLSALYDSGTGVMLKTNFDLINPEDQKGVALQNLEQRRLARQELRGGNSPREIVMITPKGTAAMQIFKVFETPSQTP